MRRPRNYAARTRVSVEDTRREIEVLLTKAGADSIATVSEPHRAMVAFRIEKAAYRFTLPLPSVDQLREKRHMHVAPLGAMQKFREQVVRANWRALLLALKAHVEADRAGIVTLEVALMPFAILPGGRIVAEEVLPRLAEMRSSGRSLPLLPGGS